MKIRRIAKRAISSALPLYLPVVRLRMHPVVLLYHDVKPAISSPISLAVSVANFRLHAAWLAEHCEVLNLGEYVRRRREGRLARNTAVITFDDGYIDSFRHGFPILRELGLPMTLFMVSGWVGAPKNVSKSDLDELVRADVEVLPHSCTHPRLAQLPAADQAREIIESRKRIEAITGKPGSIFAYPYGNYSEETVRIVQDADFEAAVTIDDKPDRIAISPFKIPRHSVPSVPLHEWAFNVYEHRRFVSAV